MSGNYQTCLDAMAVDDSPKRAAARAFMLEEYGVTIESEGEPLEVEIDGFWPVEGIEFVTGQSVDRR